ncbi:threonine/homoserine/homoserine lactone efflux protein [Rhodococcus percolatus]|uniref:hypothetical protein n=1 Tax=Rhodococcus opacus TaxID=37919 RepID=UPI0015F8C006|nr:hypothetical protein [Rhodococcus opacus]MBA8959644.1 threonine/homoserine/homoserine lactone efflux protein [Rhodococcus opacus]MBP2205210.1 threonine/homoserine/homoserine lactone efflux protein [Rhodococcus opacus]
MKQIFALVLAVVALSLVLSHWQTIVAVAAAGVLVWLAVLAVTGLRARRVNARRQERGRQSLLARRAQVQHEQYLADDERGTFGTYRPASL